MLKRTPKPKPQKTIIKTKITPAIIEIIWDRYKNGTPINEIANELAIAPSTIRTIINKGYPKLNVKPLKERLKETITIAEQLKTIDDLSAYQEILKITRPLIHATAQRIAKRLKDNPNYYPKFADLSHLLNIHKDTLKTISALKGKPTEITYHSVSLTLEKIIKPLQNPSTIDINTLTEITKKSELPPE